MNIIDVIILIIIALTAFSGYHRGFVLSFLSLVKIFISIIAARFIYPYAIEFLSQSTDIYKSLNTFLYPKISNLISETSLFTADTITGLIINLLVIIVIYSLINMVLSIIIRSIDNVFKLPVLNTINKFAGLLFGLFKGVLIIFIIYALLTPVIALNPQSSLAIATRASVLAQYFYRPEFLTNYLKQSFLDSLKLM
nr:CvpA family protein [Tissierella sp.]